MKRWIRKFGEAYRIWRYERCIEGINKITKEYTALGTVRQIQDYAQHLRKTFCDDGDLDVAARELADQLERDAELIVMKRVFK